MTMPGVAPWSEAVMYTPPQWRVAFPITFIVLIALAGVLILALQQGTLWAAAVCSGVITGVLVAISWALRHFAPKMSLAFLGAAAAPAIPLWLMSPGAGVAGIAVGGRRLRHLVPRLRPRRYSESQHRSRVRSRARRRGWRRPSRIDRLSFDPRRLPALGPPRFCRGPPITRLAGRHDHSKPCNAAERVSLRSAGRSVRPPTTGSRRDRRSPIWVASVT